MIEVSENLFVGTVAEVPPLVLAPEEWSIVNVASTYHKMMHNWQVADYDHPCYVLHVEPTLISLNWVDAAAKYFDYEGRGVDNCLKVMEFIKDAIKNNKKVFICCDQGQSRAPTMALLYLAVTDKIKNETYEESRKAFTHLYPPYKPAFGIQEFMTIHWGDFIHV